MRLKIITLNIEHGGRLLDNIVKLIYEEKPDIVTFQEVYDSMLDYKEKRFRSFTEFGKVFKSFLPFSAFQSSCRLITEVKEGVEFGNAVYSKFKIIENTKTEINKPYAIINETGLVDFSNSPSILQHVKLQVNGTSINIFNIHGIWGFDGADSGPRIEMAKIIASKIKGKKNVILAGDTNFTFEAVRTIEIIERGGVKSVFGNSLISTFNMDHKDNIGYATAAVDMVFVSPEIVVIEKGVIKVDVSDHFPLVVKFDLEV